MSVCGVMVTGHQCLGNGATVMVSVIIIRFGDIKCFSFNLWLQIWLFLLEKFH